MLVWTTESQLSGGSFSLCYREVSDPKRASMSTSKYVGVGPKIFWQTPGAAPAFFSPGFHYPCLKKAMWRPGGRRSQVCRRRKLVPTSFWDPRKKTHFAGAEVR